MGCAQAITRADPLCRPEQLRDLTQGQWLRCECAMGAPSLKDLVEAVVLFEAHIWQVVDVVLRHRLLYAEHCEDRNGYDCPIRRTVPAIAMLTGHRFKHFSLPGLRAQRSDDF